MKYDFSPSGHALALKPLLDTSRESIRIHFADGRKRIEWENDSFVIPVAWASDTELLYLVAGKPLGTADDSWYWVFSLETEESRPLIESKDVMSIVWGGKPGYLSVLTEREGQTGLFDLDTSNGILRHLPEFDSALEPLDVYPLFGHSYCPARQEVALIAWPKGDFLPEGVEPTVQNSHWSPIMDTPWIQDYVNVLPDGTKATQRELTQQAKRKTPFRLFLLDSTGKREEVVGTHRAQRPFWSPDGTILSFERSEHFDPLYNSGSASSVWFLQRKDLSLKRIGGCGTGDSTIMHPSGVLLCRLEDESISFHTNGGRVRRQSNQWTEIRITPLDGRR